MDNAGALPTYPQRSSNQRDQINRTIDESRLSANNPIASGTGPGGDIMSESRGEIISVRRGDFIGIRIIAIKQPVPPRARTGKPRCTLAGDCGARQVQSPIAPAMSGPQSLNAVSRA